MHYIRESIQAISSRAKSRSNLLNNFHNIVNHFNKQRVYLAFLKLVSTPKAEPKTVVSQKKPTKSFLK